MLGEDLVQFGSVPGGWVSAEDVECDRAEGEHVGHGIAAPRIEDRFGCQIDEAGFLRELAAMECVGSRCRGTGTGTGGENAAGLPVEDPDLRVVGIGVDNQDALRTEGAVYHAMAVGVADRVGKLTHKVQASREGEGLAALSQIVVQANFVGLAAEQDGGAEVVLVEFAGAEDSGVFERLQYAELLERGPANRFVSGFVFPRDIVNADAAGSLRGRVFGLKVLVGEAEGSLRSVP